jgi:hypothetical protein
MQKNTLEMLLYKRTKMTKSLFNTILSFLVFTSSFSAQAENPTQLLWGDTHLHSAYSADAFMAGNRSADPDVAYRYAKGEPVLHPYAGNRVQIQQPLDFLAVADHAEYLGVMPIVMGTDYDHSEAGFFEKLKSWFMVEALRYAIADPIKGTKRFTLLMPEPEIKSGDSRDPIAAAIAAGTDTGLESFGLINDESAARISASQWAKSMQAAERHNQPGKFTTLVGWEWSQTASGANLHRVVISDIDGKTASGLDPVGSDDAPYPEQLWDELQLLSEKTGGSFIAIPHNSNLSKGYMFAKHTLKGKVMTPDYARRRAKWEPILEVTQIKGDSETHPDLAPDDKFADFERFDFYLQAFPQAKGYKAQAGDTARSALKNGLVLEQEIGVNPFKFGMIGSTDSHTGMASAEEPNFWGKVAVDSIPVNKRRKDQDGYADGMQSFNGWNMSASGLAAVWAEDNTREAIIDAMKRRETYATTGPRIAVRMFAGWSYNVEDANSPGLVDIGYAGGVPMGGELSFRDLSGDEQYDAAPHFLITARRGALDNHLDRIQMVKSWRKADGRTEEKIFNIVWSGDRQLDSDGKLPPIASTADVRTGKSANTVGAAQLATMWVDPDFNSSQAAVYYARR